MAASLPQKVWINGCMNTVSLWTSPAPENRQLTRLWRHFTAARGGYLNIHWFLLLEEAQDKLG